MSEIDPEIERRLEIVVAQIGYPRESLLFVISGWSNAEVLEQSHVDGGALCRRLRDQAIGLYGSDAHRQLESWGIETTLDIGKIVFGLAENGLVQTTVQDDIDDFNNVFNFETEFSDVKSPKVASSVQWTLSMLFVLTTLVAVAVSGGSKDGSRGVFYALFSSWLAVLGLGCLCMAITNRSREWLLIAAFGIVALAAGIFSFFTFSFL